MRIFLRNRRSETQRGLHKLRAKLRQYETLRFLIRTVPCVYRLQMSGIDLPNISSLGRLSKIIKFFPNRISDKNLFEYLLYSKSEIDQELIAYLLLGSDGYFVEFGACDGLLGSNTFFLEKYQGWTGILAEPIPGFYAQIKNNRTAKAYPYAVYSSTGIQIEFSETIQPGLSTLSGFEQADRHGEQRAGAKKYNVETISLRDLLILAKAPRIIDFLSIDTEGSEFNILSQFPFEEYSFKFITIEHNHSESRAKIKELMNSNNYFEILPKYSGGDWWFVHRDFKDFS
jgi:FkbM family methyltransferase